MLNLNIERPSGAIYEGYYSRGEWTQWSPLISELGNTTNIDLMKSVLANAGSTVSERIALVDSMANDFSANPEEKKLYNRLKVNIDYDGNPNGFAIRVIRGTMNLGIPCVFGLAGIVNRKLVSQIENGKLTITDEQERSWNKVRAAATRLVTNAE